MANKKGQLSQITQIARILLICEYFLLHDFCSRSSPKLRNFSYKETAFSIYPFDI